MNQELEENLQIVANAADDDILFQGEWDWKPFTDQEIKEYASKLFLCRNLIMDGSMAFDRQTHAHLFDFSNNTIWFKFDETKI